MSCDGRALTQGRATGRALVLVEALSFWGGVDERTGRIIDTHHPQQGASLGGAVVVMPRGRGSSSSSSVLAECIRNGVAPAAIVLAEADAILALGALVAHELYSVAMPVVVLGPEDYAACAALGGVTLTVAASEGRASIAW